MLSIGDFARLGQVSPRMLRHYDHLGLLRPERVDPATGYRSYGVSQLARLHRLLALRDLGFSLEQIGDLLSDDLPVEQLRGMLQLRRAQIEDTVAEEVARMQRVEAHLRAIEGSTVMKTYDIVVKEADPIRLAEATATASGFGSTNLAPTFMEIMPAVGARLEAEGVNPGVMIAYYEEPAEDGSVVVHGGWEIGDAPMTDSGPVRVVELEAALVAAVIHKGSMADVEETYEALVRWIDASGYHATARSRELYLEMDLPESSTNVTELQMPIAK